MPPHSLHPTVGIPSTHPPPLFRASLHPPPPPPPPPPHPPHFVLPADCSNSQLSYGTSKSNGCGGGSAVGSVGFVAGALLCLLLAIVTCIICAGCAKRRSAAGPRPAPPQRQRQTREQQEPCPSSKDDEPIPGVFVELPAAKGMTRNFFMAWPESFEKKVRQLQRENSSSDDVASPGSTVHSASSMDPSGHRSLTRRFGSMSFSSIPDSKLSMDLGADDSLRSRDEGSLRGSLAGGEGGSFRRIASGGSWHVVMNNGDEERGEKRNLQAGECSSRTGFDGIDDEEGSSVQRDECIESKLMLGGRLRSDSV